MQFDAPHPAFSLNHPTNNIPSMDAVLAVSSRAWSLAFACFLVGNLAWTLLEYGFHRFLFHVDRLLPDMPAFLTLHFLMHGVHHYLPMDRCVPTHFSSASVSHSVRRLRLVMPPPMFAALSFPMTRLGYFLFPVHMANGTISGAFTFCMYPSTLQDKVFSMFPRRPIRLHALCVSPRSLPSQGLRLTTIQGCITRSCHSICAR